MKTVFGVVADECGFASKQTVERGPNGLELRRRHWSTPAAHILRHQNPVIPVDIDHRADCVVGQVVHLQRRSDGTVWAVAEVADDASPVTPVRVGDQVVEVETPFYWSMSRVGDPELGYAIDSVALTTRPCRLGATPLQWLGGSLDHRGVARERWHLSGWPSELLTRAAVARLDRPKGAPILVHDSADDKLIGQRFGVEHYQRLEDQDWRGRPPGRYEYRPSRILRVS